MLWLKCLEMVSSEMSIFSKERHSDLIPTIMVLHQGGIAELKSMAQVALMSPLLRPSLIVLSETGGLAALINALLSFLMKTANTYESGYKGYLYLFSQGHAKMKKELSKVCSSRESFTNFIKTQVAESVQASFLNEFNEYEVHILREKIEVLFTKCFILPSDVGDDFEELIERALFPPQNVADMTLDECRFRRVKTSLVLDQVKIAQLAVLDAQKDNDLENWMMENHIYDDFLHEAFLKNNIDFFVDLLDKLPHSFVTKDFIQSERYLSFLANWLITQSDEQFNRFSILDMSRPLQSQIHRALTVDQKQESKLLGVISQALFKLNLDLKLDATRKGGNSFNVRTIRAIFVIGLLTGRLQIAKSVLALSSDVLGDFLAGAHICRTIAQRLPYEKVSLENLYIDTANYLEHEAIRLMNTCHRKNYNLTEQLLLRRLPHWGNQNCIELAILSRSKQFVGHQTVQRLLKAIWRCSNNPTQQLNLNQYVALACPVLAPALIDQSIDDSAPYYIKVMQFFCTPSTIFIYGGISRICYIFYFAWILTMHFCKFPYLHELVLWLWTAALYIEFFMGIVQRNHGQLWALFRCGTSKGRIILRQYISQWSTLDTWTTIDVLTFCSFFIAFVFRLLCIPLVYTVS